MLQECELDPVYTVRETVTLFARYFRRPTDVAATLGAVGRSAKADDRVGQLSGGQKRVSTWPSAWWVTPRSSFSTSRRRAWTLWRAARCGR